MYFPFFDTNGNNENIKDFDILTYYLVLWLRIIVKACNNATVSIRDKREVTHSKL